MTSVAYLLPVHEAVNTAEVRLALQSIADQKLPSDVAVRLYVGVDGPISAEKSQIIEEFAPYKLIQLEQRAGLPVVLNRLIDSLEDEEFVFRMDGDDINHVDRTIEQLAYMRENPGIGLCGTACTQIDENGHTVNERRYPTDPEQMTEFICKGIPLLHPTFCFRRSALDQLRYDESRFYQQDLAILFEALANGIKLGNIDKPLLYWRTGATFHSRRTWARALAECSLYLKGIYRLHGLTWKYFYPLARLALRLLPVSWFAKLEKANLRRTLFEQAIR